MFFMPIANYFDSIFLVGYTIIVFAIPACMIIIAAFYFHDCPEEEFIPFYLLVGGGFEVFNKLFFLCTNIQIHNNAIMNTCRIGWFILGKEYINYTLFFLYL
jgi:hypothetical protein